MDLIQIRCQEKVCPYGKQAEQRCIFGEIYKEDLPKDVLIRERHKCNKAKQGRLQFVMVNLTI